MKKIQSNKNKLTSSAEETVHCGKETMSEQTRVVAEITPLSRQEAEARRY